MENTSLSHLSFIIVGTLIALAGWSYYAVMTLRRHLHWLQLEDYSPRRLYGFALRRWLSIAFHPAIIALPIIYYSYRFMQGDPTPGQQVEAFGITLWGLLCGWEGYRLYREQQKGKKKLVMTPRAKRIFVIGVAALFLMQFAFKLLIPEHLFGLRLVAPMYFASFAASLWLTLAVGVLWPYEEYSKRKYIQDAKRILTEIRPLVVGITGSYGKTGTKELLAAMLSDRYNLYRPPGSYNTLMGVTRAIREGLRPYHEAFVVEMGAYREGSIKKVCDLVHPTHGIVTAVGVQHLERFGSQEVIARAKGELVRALPIEGIAVLNGDDPLCRKMAKGRRGETVFFSVEGSVGGRPIPPMFAKKELLPAEVKLEEEREKRKEEKGYVTARDIRISITGSDFELQFADGEALPVHLSLLGRAAVANACAAAAMADKLGVARNGIARALATMPHVRHRLEPKQGDGGVTVIDDAFNSNPTGAATALEVLSTAIGGKRILVTPGMIELGAMETEANYRFGRQAALSCDLALLIGVKRIEPIRKGLLVQNFPERNIWTASTLKEGLERLYPTLKAGDTMLLENDLPDQYAGM